MVISHGSECHLYVNDSQIYTSSPISPLVLDLYIHLPPSLTYLLTHFNSYFKLNIYMSSMVPLALKFVLCQSLPRPSK